MDLLIVNPTCREQVANAIIEAVAAANKSYRARTVYISDRMASHWAQSVEEHPCGRLEDNGGGVANSYGYRAESSAVAVVWATDASGMKHIRIQGSRMSCSGRHVGSLLGHRTQQQKLADQDAELVLVYDQLKQLWAGNDQTPAGFSRKLKKNAQDAVTWLVLADYLEERDRMEEATLIRRFFAPIEAIR